MTFLEYCFRHYVGTPHSGRYWRCHVCRHHTPSIELNEPLRSHQIKFRCYRCRTWGDELDLIRHFHPRARYPERLELAAGLRRGYEAELRPAAEYDATDEHATKPPEHTRNLSFPPRGHRAVGPIDSAGDPRVALMWGAIVSGYGCKGLAVDRAYAVITELYERGYFRDLGRVVGYVLAYWEAFNNWRDEVNTEHLRECRDRGCEWICCRALRGLPPLPPLTPEQRRRRALQREHEAEEWQRESDQFLEEVHATIERRTRVCL